MAVNLFQQVPVSVLTSEKPFFPAVSLLRLLTEEKALKFSLICSFYITNIRCIGGENKNVWSSGVLDEQVNNCKYNYKHGDTSGYLGRST